MNIDTRTEIRAYREPWICDRIAIRVARIDDTNGTRTLALANPMTFTVLDKNEMFCEPPSPTMHLRPDEAQHFMDELWRVGIRPTEGAGSVGQMAATEKHLEDMRQLVFKKQTV